MNVGFGFNALVGTFLLGIVAGVALCNGWVG